jgi:poly-beta-1,6-N-acetyl-D-glucosamine synthase
LFRRTALEEVYLRFGSGRELRHAGEVEGPFEGDTFAEDFDLSLAILSLGGRCAYEPDAVSHTKAPDWSSRLLNQRYRWGRGTFQVLRKFLGRSRTCPELMRPHLVCWLGVTYALELVLMPLLGLCGLGFFVAFLGTGGSSAPLLACAAAFVAVNLNAAAFFVAMHKDRLSTLAVLPAYDFYHTFLINSGWVIAVIDEIRGRSMRW